MRMTPLIERLREAGYAHVEGAIEWAGLREARDLPRVPLALYVVPEDDNAAPNRMAGIVDQRVKVAFSVIIVLDVANRARGIDERLDDEREKVRDLLVAWAHPAASMPTEYVGGRLLSVDGYRLAWAVRFSSAYHLRKQAQ